MKNCYRAVMVGAVIAISATGAMAEQITPANKVRDVKQSVDVRGNQIVAAIGQDVTAKNINAGIFAKDAAQIDQNVSVRGNQIVAAIGVRAYALNANAVIAGGMSR